MDGITLQLSEATSRGMIAAQPFDKGDTIVSIPMTSLALSAESLHQSQPRELKGPSLEDVHRLMTSRSVKDTVLIEQVHLALLLAAERCNPQSRWMPYFEVLPHPAIDDAAAIRNYKDLLEDPLALVEWDDYQKELLAVLHIALRRWRDRLGESGSSSAATSLPTIEVAYWALRTVLARMHMLPAHSLAPEALGSHLNYTALSSVDRANTQVKWRRRLRAAWGSLVGNRTDAAEYRLVPTVVPLLDMVSHVKVTNAEVAVHANPALRDTACVELRAIRQINKGEVIGMHFNSSQSLAFQLYRFGFLPE